MEPSEVEQYYDDYGPPIVSYYPPPWEYGYLYDWVPWPFWWGGFGFGGFFVLGDFDRLLITTTRFTNHVRNANGTVSRVDPATRASGTAASSRLAGTNRAGQGSRFGSANAQAGARAILNRSTGTAAGARLGNTANASRTSSAVFTRYGQVFVHSANEELELRFLFEVTVFHRAVVQQRPVNALL